MNTDKQHSLLGHNDVWKTFQTTIAHHAMPTAWLLHGTSGIGKASMACCMAHALLYPPITERPSLVARKNLRRHSDFFLIDPDDEENPNMAERKSGQIAIDDVRRMRDFLALRPGWDGWRTVVIDQADRLNHESANGLLKSLEEPPQQCVFFIIADHPGRLPLTLLSRCRSLVMHPLEEENFQTVLARMEIGQDGKNWYRASSGSPGMALRLIAEGFSTIEKLIQAVWPKRKDEGKPGKNDEQKESQAENIRTIARMIGQGKDGKDRWFLLYEILRLRIRTAILEEENHMQRQGLLNLWDDLQRLELEVPAFHLDTSHGVFAVFSLIHRYSQMNGRV